MQLFWRQGYEGTSTAQLTAAMGIAAPSLYAAFGSKEALYRETLLHYQSRFGQTMDSLSDERLTAREAVQQMLLAAAKQYTDAQHIAGCMVATAAIQHAPEHLALAQTLTEARKAAQAKIQQCLQRGFERGELAVGVDVAALAQFFALVIQGLAVQARDGANTEQLLCVVSIAMRCMPSVLAGSDRT